MNELRKPVPKLERERVEAESVERAEERAEREAAEAATEAVAGAEGLRCELERTVEVRISENYRDGRNDVP